MMNNNTTITIDLTDKSNDTNLETSEAIGCSSVDSSLLDLGNIVWIS